MHRRIVCIAGALALCGAVLFGARPAGAEVADQESGSLSVTVQVADCVATFWGATGYYEPPIPWTYHTVGATVSCPGSRPVIALEVHLAAASAPLVVWAPTALLPGVGACTNCSGTSASQHYAGLGSACMVMTGEAVVAGDAVPVQFGFGFGC